MSETPKKTSTPQEKAPISEKTEQVAMSRRRILQALGLAGGLAILGLGKKVAEKYPEWELSHELKNKNFYYDEATENYLDPSNKRIIAMAKQLEKEKLVPVLNSEGHKMKDIEGEVVMLRESAAQKLHDADVKMFAKTGEHIKIRRHFRSNHTQRKINYMGGVSAEVGKSFHELGLAIDVQNWAPAQEYLVAEGLLGGMYTDSKKDFEYINKKKQLVIKRNFPFRYQDANHFSLGELKPADDPYVWVRMAEYIYFDITERGGTEAVQDAKTWIKTSAPELVKKALEAAETGGTIYNWLK